MIWSILAAILAFGMIILVHELGHFLVARRFGVTVQEFSIGFGPELFSKTAASGTKYALRALPVGGFVSMAGEDEHSDDPHALCNKSKAARFCILAAGAGMNLVLGFVIMLVYTACSGALYSNQIERFLVPDDAGGVVSTYQGLYPGDEILSVNGARTFVRTDYVLAAMRTGGKPCRITVRRGNDTLTVENFVFAVDTEDGIAYGNPNFFVPKLLPKNPGTVLRETAGQTASSIKMVVLSLLDLITGKYSLDAVSGPVGIVSEIHETASYGGILPVLFLLSVLAVNVGIFNLLPFPALDGGRILFLLIEVILRRPINRKTEEFLNLLGLVILFGAMIFITFHDLIAWL